MEVLLSQQVQTVAADAAQQCMQDARGQNPVAGVQHRPYQRLEEQAAPARPALCKCMRVPGEIGHRPHRGQVGHAAFNPPELR